MKFSRLAANAIVALVLAVVLVGLLAIIVAERCERNVQPVSTFYQDDYEPGAWKALDVRR